MSTDKSVHFMNNNLPITFAIYMSLLRRAYIPTEQRFSLWARALSPRAFSFTLHSLSLTLSKNEKHNDPDRAVSLDDEEVAWRRCGHVNCFVFTDQTVVGLEKGVGMSSGVWEDCTDESLMLGKRCVFVKTTVSSVSSTRSERSHVFNGKTCRLSGSLSLVGCRLSRTR